MTANSAVADPPSSHRRIMRRSARGGRGR
jgi:hypothetical protein